VHESLYWWDEGTVIFVVDVSEWSKSPSQERMKTSHFKERIALGAVQLAQRRDGSTQCELAAFNTEFGIGLAKFVCAVVGSHGDGGAAGLSAPQNYPD